MPNSLSAKKNLRQTETRTIRNRARKSKLRGQIRKLRESVAAGNIEQAEEQYKDAAKMLDRISAKNIIHRNTAARTKSRLQLLIKKAKQAS